MEPITFEPIYMQRIWGGRRFEETYGRHLPDSDQLYGEAWEIVDREDAQSLVSSSEFFGKSLNHLWNNYREEIFGENLPQFSRFPLLIKILDCAADLSIQVHPPADVAEKFGGEPKTEMWYIADCKPGAKLYVGLKHGSTRTTFEQAISEGTIADQVHAITPEKGQSIFIPSGRLHAIGADFLIHEIQQNSDTTYRVFDWNRTDPAGIPRELHVAQSLACIDFTDLEPEMDTQGNDPSHLPKTLASCPHFTTTLHHLPPGETFPHFASDRFSLVTIVSGSLENKYRAGQTLLLPKFSAPLLASEPSSILRITL